MTGPDAARGLLLAFDGLDSTGKATQSGKLADRLARHGHTVKKFQSPDYATPSGQELKLRLQNKLGEWTSTPWEQKMRLFAANRAEHRTEVAQALAEGQMVVYDRYVPSSLAFITVEALTPQVVDLYRAQVQDAVSKEEYQRNSMPREDISIFLDVPPEVALNLLEKRKEWRSDAHEHTDHSHVQERLYNEYDLLCSSNPTHFLRIPCVMSERLLQPDEVTELVWETLLQKFPFLST